MEMKHALDCWIDAEANLRKIDIKSICTFGISALDDALVGILPNDLICLGADSGVGKSEIALDIALHNAYLGHKVALYFIEGGVEEAINRIRWKMIKNHYYAKGYSGIDMDYRKWRTNQLRCEILDKIQFDCMIEFKERIKDNLYLYSFEEGFTIDMLINSLGWFSTTNPQDYISGKIYDIDLLIIDHLQYFTLTNPSNEFSEMTQILLKVKNITTYHNIPVILISHLRKKDKDRGLPSQEDFFGTSNIAKISSQSIVIASHYQGDDAYNEIYPTFFRFVKSRTGLRSSIAALCDFNIRKGAYENNYSIYQLIIDKPKPEPIEKYRMPRWAYEGLNKRGLLK